MTAPPNAKAAAEGVQAQGDGEKIKYGSGNSKHTQPESLSQLEQWIETAEAFERLLAPV